MFRTPEEWLSVGNVDGVNYPVPAQCFLQNVYYVARSALNIMTLNKSSSLLYSKYF